MPFSQTDSFETDFGNWTNPGGDDFDWERNNTTTPSSGTGPGGGFAGSWYVYTETSSPIANGNEALFLSNVINASLYVLELDFREHMVGMGDGTGYLAVEVFDGSVWNEEYRQTGDNGATEDGTDYVARNVDLSAYNNTDFQIRFRLHVSNGGNAYQNDCALDNITISGPDANAYEQEGFRFRNDDGSEITATWRQPQDVDDTANQEERFRLRILTDATGDPLPGVKTRQYKRSDEPDSEWRDV